MHRSATLDGSIPRTATCWPHVVLMVAALVGGWSGQPHASAAEANADLQTKPQLTEDQKLEFFETRVRPLLASQCYDCHGSSKAESRLRVNHVQFLFRGGERGPAVVPGEPDRSLLVEAVSYGNTRLQMPPRSKLSDEQIETLTHWVEIGAPWPDEPLPQVGEDDVFDLDARAASHWAWQPMQASDPPDVADADWPRSTIDRHILASLEENELTPADEADRRTLIRRLHFDLVGLPPTPEEVEAFVNDASEDAYEQLVDRLLASPHFGERWARHWMDLTRYAETRGHEIEPLIPNAYQYRDYLIRAFNADVPYDQFVIEHIAGDLLDEPRVNEQGWNESMLGTGFWFLGEEVHSPVDIRADELERLDNRVDVMSKSFLAMTVSCARCHDHMFDAISADDYHAILGFLQSAGYSQGRFETREHNRDVFEALNALRDVAGPVLVQSIAEASRPAADRAADYLTTAREALLTAEPADEEDARPDIVFEDWEHGTYDGWRVEGTAFGDRPATQQTIADYQGDVAAEGDFFVNSHNIRNGEDTAEGDAHTGRLTSDAFTIERRYITLLVGGGAHEGRTCVNLLIDGEVVRTATGQNHNRMRPVRWDVQAFAGQEARIEVVDDHTGGWGNIGMDHVVFTDTPGEGGPLLAAEMNETVTARAEALATERDLDADLLREWAAALLKAKDDTEHLLHPFAAVALDPRAADDPHHAADLVRGFTDGWRGQLERDDQLASLAPQTLIDYTDPQTRYWYTDGYAWGPRPMQPGDIWLSERPDQPIARLHTDHAAVKDPTWDKLRTREGTERDHGRLGDWDRSGRVLRTPKAELESGHLWYLVRGSGRAYAVVDQHLIIAGPLHGSLLRDYARDDADPAAWRWVHHPLGNYRGHRLHVEFSPYQPDSDFAVAMVVDSDQRPPLPGKANRALLDALIEREKQDSAAGLADTYHGLFIHAAGQMLEANVADRDTAELAAFIVDNPQLFLTDADRETIAETAGPYIARQRELSGSIRAASRTAPVMLEGNGVDEYLLIRGSPANPSEQPVPRRFLEAIVGPDPEPYPDHASGRLRLAREMVEPTNPLTARVMVNRIWHHLFGRGIVPTVDNFGELGLEPTHPELLDHLALQFIEDDWSIKRTIRRIVTSSTYRQAAMPGRYDHIDRNNDLVHHMPLRRLQGEVIRDTMLAISGRLDTQRFGPSVEVHLTSFMEGRGRPGDSGPLDGAGRRSVYTKIRRNFLPPMMLAFDMPIPFSSVGQRPVSNVPAQALILMNDPFVLEQAQRWTRRMFDKDLDAEGRIERMYLEAFGRSPSGSELADAANFLREQTVALGGEADAWETHRTAWTDFGHVLFNVKEFIFIE